MAKLDNKYLGAYISKVLLDTLEEFNIKLNIKRYLLKIYLFY
jgi:hypothetical protein